MCEKTLVEPVFHYTDRRNSWLSFIFKKDIFLTLNKVKKTYGNIYIIIWFYQLPIKIIL